MNKKFIDLTGQKFNKLTVIHLGFYDTKEEARTAYIAKAKELFGEFVSIRLEDK